jgi:hypothetical protein
MCWPGAVDRLRDAGRWTSRAAVRGCLVGAPGLVRWTRRRPPRRRWCPVGRAPCHRRVGRHAYEALGRSAGRVSRPWHPVRRTVKRRSRGRAVRPAPIVRASRVSRRRRLGRVRVELSHRVVRADPGVRACGAVHRNHGVDRECVGAGRSCRVAPSRAWAWPARRRYLALGPRRPLVGRAGHRRAAACQRDQAALGALTVLEGRVGVAGPGLVGPRGLRALTALVDRVGPVERGGVVLARRPVMWLGEPARSRRAALAPKGRVRSLAGRSAVGRLTGHTRSRRRCPGAVSRRRAVR